MLIRICDMCNNEIEGDLKYLYFIDKDKTRIEICMNCFDELKKVIKKGKKLN